MTCFYPSGPVAGLSFFILHHDITEPKTKNYKIWLRAVTTMFGNLYGVIILHPRKSFQLDWHQDASALRSLFSNSAPALDSAHDLVGQQESLYPYF